MFDAPLETLLCMDIGKDQQSKLLPWLLSCLPKFTGLKELYVSDNPNLHIDTLLREITTSSMSILQSLCAADCSFSTNKISLLQAPSQYDGLSLLTRLDVSGSLSCPD